MWPPGAFTVVNLVENPNVLAYYVPTTMVAQHAWATCPMSSPITHLPTNITSLGKQVHPDVKQVPKIHTRTIKKIKRVLPMVSEEIQLKGSASN